MISTVMQELSEAAAEGRLVTVVRREGLEEMDEFNAAIAGPIEVVAEFRGEGA